MKLKTYTLSQTAIKTLGKLPENIIGLGIVEIDNNQLFRSKLIGLDSYHYQIWIGYDYGFNLVVNRDKKIITILAYQDFKIAYKLGFCDVKSLVIEFLSSYDKKFSNYLVNFS